MAFRVIKQRREARRNAKLEEIFTVSSSLQLLLLQMVYKPKYLNLGEHGHWFIAFDATIANLLSISTDSADIFWPQFLLGQGHISSWWL